MKKLLLSTTRSVCVEGRGFVRIDTEASTIAGLGIAKGNSGHTVAVVVLKLVRCLSQKREGVSLEPHPPICWRHGVEFLGN